MYSPETLRNIKAGPKMSSGVLLHAWQAGLNLGLSRYWNI